MNVELMPEAPPRAKVVLLFPRFRAPQYPVWMPAEIMTIATALWNAGYKVRVIDDRLEPEAEAILLGEAKDALFVGCSARPGDQVVRVHELFGRVKEKHPQVATVFGGWFPTVFTRACLEMETVDIAVQGQGDVSVVEMADRLLNRESLQGLAGVNAKINGELILNERRPLEAIDETPRIPYPLFPVEQYVTFDRCLSYYSSRGCPASCTFCSVPCAYPSEWSGYSAGRVVDEIELLTRSYGARLFKIHDTNFFADPDRVKAICRGFLERSLEIRWVADVRVQDLLAFDHEMWDLLERSGCAEMVTGGEAGCDSQLEAIAKECTADEIHRAAALTLEHDIKIRLNFIVGLHGEGRQELLGTLRLLERLQSMGDRVMFQFYRYTPLPVSELGEKTWRLKRRGHDGTVPHDAASIVNIPLNHDAARLFWLSPAEERRVKRLYYFYLPLVYYFRDNGRPGLKRWILNRLVSTARVRVRHGITAFPFEAWLCRLFKRPMPRSREFEWKQHLC